MNGCISYGLWCSAICETQGDDSCREQVIFLVSSTLILLVLTYLMIRRQVRPLKKLARAANEMSMDIQRLW
ncbi:hypothetical protein O9993_02635 [Vibrio lentus]|nr:hypothetical protein [Vibrio lentus]